MQDPQGASIAAATVTVRSADTGLVRTARAGERGEYRLEFLPPGNYEVEIAAAGFRSFRQTSVPLQVGQLTRSPARPDSW